MAPASHDKGWDQHRVLRLPAPHGREAAPAATGPRTLQPWHDMEAKGPRERQPRTVSPVVGGWLTLSMLKHALGFEWDAAAHMLLLWRDGGAADAASGTLFGSCAVVLLVNHQRQWFVNVAVGKALCMQPALQARPVLRSRRVRSELLCGEEVERAL